MAVYLFSSLKSVCKTVEDVADEKWNELRKVLSLIEDREQGLPIHKMCCISDLRTEIIEGLDQLLFLGHNMLFSPDCNRTTNPDVWSHPDNTFYDVMVRRTNGTPCRGYDYHDPYSMGRGH
uniref:uncharacterized protein LOC122593387 n=1 Tax=Erigeron canadensis TaxID=72917 RepID=UPI001CB97F4B|nr:uncharacterized protein LOC122593387 [Erigeron canadensis]